MGSHSECREPAARPRDSPTGDQPDGAVTERRRLRPRAPARIGQRLKLEPDVRARLQRASGSFARTPSERSSPEGHRPDRREGWRLAVRIAESNPAWLCTSKAFFPVAISYRSRPAEKTEIGAAASTGFPSSCSGDTVRQRPDDDSLAGHVRRRVCAEVTSPERAAKPASPDRSRAASSRTSSA